MSGSLDVGYLDTDSYSVMQPTAWIPLLDATRKNGCMEVSIPRDYLKIAKIKCGYFVILWKYYLHTAQKEKVKTILVFMFLPNAPDFFIIMLSYKS